MKVRDTHEAPKRRSDAYRVLSRRFGLRVVRPKKGPGSYSRKGR